MGTVVIAAVTYNVYGEHAGAGSCDQYLDASLVYNTVWNAASSDDQKRAMVTVARELNRQIWQGTPTQAYPSVQPLVWPRTGVVDRNGAPVGSATIPQVIIDGSYELVGAVVADIAVASAANAGNSVKRMKAGSAEIEFFRPIAGGRFPTSVQELVAEFLASGAASNALAVAEVDGMDQESAFGTPFNLGTGGL